jgi:hypothetical protein
VVYDIRETALAAEPSEMRVATCLDRMDAIEDRVEYPIPGDYDSLHLKDHL